MLSMIIPVLDGLCDFLQSTEEGLDGLRRIFVELIDTKFGDFMHDEELVVAILVDPRFKSLLLASDELRTNVIDW